MSFMIRGGYMLDWSVERFADRMAIVFRGKEMSFRDVDNRVNRLANGLINLGLKRGYRAATLLYNSPRAIEVRFALMKAGLCMIALNTRQSEEENVYIINHSEACLLFIDEEFVGSWEKMRDNCKKIRHVVVTGTNLEDGISYEQLIESSSPQRPEVMVSLDDLERVAYTSGTTGRPKGVMKTVGNDLARLRNDFMNRDMLMDENDVMLNVAPLTHAARNYAHMVYLKGGKNIILRRFDVKEVLETIQRDRVTMVFLVPTMIVRLVLYPFIRDYDVTSLRRIFYGTAPMPVDKLKMAIELFGNIFFQHYGMTEATQPVTFLSAQDHIVEENEKKFRRLSSAGKAALGVEVRIVNEQGQEVGTGEEGEILVRGDIVAKGYWKDPEATREAFTNGWFHTGDVGRKDEEEFIYIVDRKKDMIISGGFNIYPREVEQVIEAHEGVEEVAVIGVPDEIYGEAVKALIVPRRGAGITEEEIVQLCTKHIASYKKPKSIEFVEELPKNFQGKILKRALKEKYWKGLDKRV